MNIRLGIFSVAVILFYACSPSKQIARSAQKNVLSDPALQTAHVGISVYDPSTGKYLYNYQGDKYFVPASNTKIPTCYAAMKYLGDSIPALEVQEYDNYIFLKPLADPTLLHPDYKVQPVMKYLQSLENSNKNIWFGRGDWQSRPWGSGWSWSDYDASYMAERSAMPVYGNLVTITGKKDSMDVVPSYFHSNLTLKNSSPGYVNNVDRSQFKNEFVLRSGGSKAEVLQVPFITSDSLNFRILMDSLKSSKYFNSPGSEAPNVSHNEKPRVFIIYSQPTDSLLSPMMHRSDNFFAEQTLLMVSNKMLGKLNEGRVIDSLLKTDFKDLPQKPRWADGSGLSRFNLFTPQDFVMILNKMKNAFGMERIKTILPTGDEGTLEGLYKSEVGYIYAKTGTLSGVLALSGFLYTKKNKMLIFSILINNHQASATELRRVMEKFVKTLREKN
jgi:serine-type D-Ala-D-Ala carboxypeptidase/endopeptidase (penicillin-binding protein 4)